MSVLTGTPTAQALPMEVYQPTGDTETSRPLIIHMHTGTFLPILYKVNAGFHDLNFHKNRY